MGRRLLFETPSVAAHRVECPGGHHGWSPPEEVARHGLVLILDGVFVRRSDGVETVVERSVGYLERPGEEQQVAHPAGGDVCTWLSFDPSLWHAVRGDDAAHVPLRLDARHHLWHLLLTKAAPADRHAGEELAVRLLGDLGCDERRRSNGARAGTAAIHRRVVDRARQALAEDPDLSLTELATTLAVSPHHLSRIFSAELGQTLSRYRLGLRVRRALDRLAGDEPLARVAADAGFADHAHLARAVRRELGETPSALRRLLRSPR